MTNCPLNFDCNLMVGKTDKYGTCLNWIDCLLINNSGVNMDYDYYLLHPIKRRLRGRLRVIVVTKQNFETGYNTATLNDGQREKRQTHRERDR